MSLTYRQAVTKQLGYFCFVLEFFLLYFSCRDYSISFLPFLYFLRFKRALLSNLRINQLLFFLFFFLLVLSLFRTMAYLGKSFFKWRKLANPFDANSPHRRSLQTGGNKYGCHVWDSNPRSQYLSNRKVRSQLPLINRWIVVIVKYESTEI
jgi:hypothetical protein